MTDVAQTVRLNLTNALQHLAVWNNPVVWKNFHSRLRMQALFQLLLVLIISTFMTLTIFGGLDRFQGDPVEAARAGILPLGIVQWLILILSGTGRISSSLIHERVTGTIDYTRLTPMSPMRKVIGYLFGLPVREYIAFAITMPFMIFLLIRGEIPLSVTLPVYAVFFSSALLYHLIGTVFGLVMKEWRLSVVFTIGIVILINLILPFFSYLGFPFLQYLTIRPVVVEKVLPLLADNSAWRDAIPPGIIGSQVDFFSWKISTTFFSLIVQGSLIFTLGLMVYRKWENSFSHALSKLYALYFYIGLQIFCIGTLWPNLVFSEFSSLRQNFGNEGPSAEELAIIIPMIYSFFSICVVFWLLYVIIPSREEYRAGLLRKQKLGIGSRDIDAHFDDHAGALISAIVLALTTMGFIMLVQSTMISVGPLSDLSISGMDYFKLPLAAGLIILYYYVSLEYLEINKFAIMFLLLWIVPILVAIFLGVTMDFENFVVYIGSISPISMTVISVQGLATENLQGEEFEVINNAYWIGAAAISSTTAIMAVLLKRFKDATRGALLSK